MDKFVIRQIVSIITRKHFRKTWMRLNKIHLVPVYSYLIFIFIRNSVRRKFHFFNDDLRDRQTSQLFWQKPCSLVSSTSVTLPFCCPRALTSLCFKVLSARVCSVNLRLLTHTTPLFCFFYFKLLFSKTLGLVAIYSSFSIDDPFRLSRPTKLYWSDQPSGITRWEPYLFWLSLNVPRSSPLFSCSNFWFLCFCSTFLLWCQQKGHLKI